MLNLAVHLSWINKNSSSFQDLFLYIYIRRLPTKILNSSCKRRYKIYGVICHLLPLAVENNVGFARASKGKRKREAALRFTINGFSGLRRCCRKMESGSIHPAKGYFLFFTRVVKAWREKWRQFLSAAASIRLVVDLLSAETR